MTEVQIVRNLMAEAGVEMIPKEAEKLLWIHNQLMDLSKIPLKDLKLMMDKNNIGDVRLFNTIKKLKRIKKNKG